MARKVIVACVCVVIFAAAVSAFAEDVYVTARGKKYHQATCQLIKNKNAQKISKEEAIAQGLQPCGRCFKADISSSAVDASTKASVAQKSKKLSKTSTGKNSSVE